MYKRVETPSKTYLGVGKTSLSTTYTYLGANRSGLRPDSTISVNIYITQYHTYPYIM